MENRKMKILIADDEDGLRLSMAGILEMEGHNVVAAEDGYKAIEKVKEGSFDIAFLDIKMPGINGVETFKEIKKMSPETVVIMMTAFAVNDLVKEAINEGAFACIHKPFDMDTIISTIKEVSSRPFVLAIDDDPALCSLLYDRLKGSGFQIVTLSSGFEGVELVKRKIPDVVLLDVMMDGMDGIATLEKLKEILGPECPKTIVMSSYDVSPKFDAAKKLGAVECISKPFDLDRIKEIIRDLVEKNVKPKIIVVDDDPDVCDTIKSVLAAGGYDVDVAYSGMEIVNKIKGEASKAVILDARQMNADSIELYEKIKQANSQVGVVFIASGSTEDGVGEMIRKNRFLYLRKPFDPEQLIQLLEDITESKHEG